METLDQPEKEEPILATKVKNELHPLGIIILGFILLILSGLTYLVCIYFRISSNDFGSIPIATLIGGILAIIAGILKLFIKRMRY